MHLSFRTRDYAELPRGQISGWVAIILAESKKKSVESPAYFSESRCFSVYKNTLSQRYTEAARRISEKETKLNYSTALNLQLLT